MPTYGSGYNLARHTLRVAFQNGGHAWSKAFWGNTDDMEQCDYSLAASDGYVIWMHIHDYFH